MLRRSSPLVVALALLPAACGDPASLCETGRQGGRRGKWFARGLGIRRYVGLETDLRKFAVFLPAGRHDRAGGVHVRKSLVLADNLFRDGYRLPGCRARRITEAARFPGDLSKARLALLSFGFFAGLLLIGTTSECREKVAGWYERIAVAGETDGVAGLGRAIYGEKSKKQIAGDAQGIADVTRMLKSLHSDPLTPKLRDIRCPALMTVGENDPMGPRASEIVHAAMPAGQARLLRVPEKGHWLQLEAVEAVVPALDAWLDEFGL